MPTTIYLTRHMEGALTYCRVPPLQMAHSGRETQCKHMNKSYEDHTWKRPWAVQRIAAGTNDNDHLLGWFLETEIKYAFQ